MCQTLAMSFEAIIQAKWAPPKAVSDHAEYNVLLMKLGISLQYDGELKRSQK